MGFLGLFGKSKDASAPAPAPAMAANMFAETERQELPCDCGCGRKWLLSKGTVRVNGATHAFVAVPTRHGEDRMAFLALGDGAQPSRWVWLRSSIQGENFAAGIGSAKQLPFASMVSPTLEREQVLAEPALKQRVFAAHDFLLAAHPDLRAHFFPDKRGRDFSFQMPDCVFAQPKALRSPRNQQNFAECGERLFVRALLPIAISDGTELRIGIWFEVSSDDFFRLMDAWNEPSAYLATKLSGKVENALSLGGERLTGATAQLAPRTADQCLFVSGMELPAVQRLMGADFSVRDFPALVNELQQSLKRHAALA